MVVKTERERILFCIYCYCEGLYAWENNEEEAVEQYDDE